MRLLQKLYRFIGNFIWKPRIFHEKLRHIPYVLKVFFLKSFFFWKSCIYLIFLWFKKTQLHVSVKIYNLTYFLNHTKIYRMFWHTIGALCRPASCQEQSSKKKPENSTKLAMIWCDQQRNEANHRAALALDLDNCKWKSAKGSPNDVFQLWF